ncbi:transcription-repair coupling factor [Alkalilimnicola sp. S0819]|uniref:transcription-repair coupling factor n=1 Tax=Alkalilimnicola sp. S0819 TaxID=2613922 RepID=UPI001262A920|nr:transcription-repair coupling factor [Alkalilimnicola sp. S0819]KAB7627639.1 transcription-repair coupling factor [Alkalilimnicola sp. S0819]MPQ15804.1 transcription-repair coupling factor [Alkalilimnicola sp. S0819]
MSSTASVFQPPLPAKAGQKLHWRQLPEDATALALARAAAEHPGLMLIVTGDSHGAQQLERALRFFRPAEDAPFSIPDWETLPYDVFSPHQDIISERLASLYRLPRTRRGILIVPAATLMQRLPPVSWLEGRGLLVKRGDTLELEAMRARLEQAGYSCVSEVMEHGEFAVRGSILDLYPMGSRAPYRIDLFDEEVDSIRIFDPENQRSLEQVEQINLLPAREYPTDEAGITRFRQAFRARFEGDPKRSLIYREVSAGHMPNGIEYYLPLFFEQTATLFDYLPEDTLTVRLADVDRAAEQIWHQIEERYEQRRHDPERPLLPPDELFLRPHALRETLNRYRQVLTTAEDNKGRAFTAAALPDLRLEPKASRPAARLEAFIDGFQGRVLLLAETAGRREALLERLQGSGLRPEEVADWRAFVEGSANLAIGVGPLESGLRLDDQGLALIPEAALFGERAQQRRRRRGASQRLRDPDTIIRDLTDLREGAPVVHEAHGVGRYLGLQTLELGGVATEFLTLEYARGDKVYVPVASLHLVSRYTGAEGDNAPLHKLGTDHWEKARRKAAEKARDVAAELLDIYARRAAKPGHRYRLDEQDYQAFADSFPFEETADQANAINAVIQDLQAAQPMDRVVCGDVGFGKTEVAMRAAFVAAQDGRQVAVLVPTTLLANQHYQNFRDRFADWPLRIEVISRFSTGKEQSTVLRDVREGKVDILIGTHKLLQDTVKFSRLGLVIIDEEHRFGVRQKERLKSLRADVDMLTLTATPIPRTLNMSLQGLRELSVIATPPARRLAVKTFLSQWNDALVQEACQRELKRGGQVYVLHNDVDSIQRKAQELEALVPEARVRIAHGQMPERDLERVMLDFYHQRFNILVCTTIVESGIDVPSANTMIINRADRLGLAQLHQLRGRVGRSHHRAYCYLIAPPARQMTPDAVKRLEAITVTEDLGVGFTLASHDLEIRGAGELLGEGQSGQIHEVGFSLYNELLERAVKDLKAGREPELARPLHQGTEVDLGIPALLPEDYLPDVHARLVMYKRLSNAPDREALRELQVEMIDRFGLLPPPGKNLLRITELKLQAQALGLRKVEAGPRGGALHFGEQPQVDPGVIVGLIQSQPQVYKLEGQEKLRFSQTLAEPEDRIGAVAALLGRLGPTAQARATS